MVPDRQRNEVSKPSHPFKNIQGLLDQQSSNQVTKVIDDPRDPKKMIESSQQPSMPRG